ncbi:oligopeptide ABC transporter substrate-binding protein OppA [Alginatibacterium sediminis]|uniref:Oligopeptide ABC transporter substrate-binding protein OppA n=1 Tax=Alginatibacterium sediminis TaxID=2164068 RepID=A0A420EAU3_9ALTE|nr:ABC transporter substrate-binding protein [Alginatibacterium sediminis]RKF17773.1 oligopeptide ABC transporter substrate-binding protein OppA [Alginatibacterium sediminis]
MRSAKTVLSAAISIALLTGVANTALAAEVPAGTTLAEVQELVRGNGTEPASLDPHKTEGVPESHILRDLFEGLVNQDADGKIVPGVAETWTTEGNKVYTFNLRKDAKWSNGDPVTAHDFVYSLQRAVTPATASPYSWYLEMTTMQNAGEIIAGNAKPDSLGVEALDDYTLKITLDSAVPYFVKMMAHTTVKPVHKATVEKFGDKWTAPENYVSNGAYVLSKWVVNERIEMVRNESYWDNEKTVINKVTYLPIENQVAEMNRFLAGEIDLTNEVPLEHFKRLKKDHADSLNIKGNLCSYYYEFNNNKAPFDDVRVRSALSYAIDRDIVTEKVLGQGQVSAYSFTPSIIEGFSPPVSAAGQMTQDERNEKAKALLAEAGFGPDNQLEFTLLYNTSENHKKIALAVSQNWKKNLGVKVNLENQEWKTYLSTKREGGHEVSRAGWCGDYNEASTFLSLMQSNNSSNTAFYNSADYDGKMAKTLEVDSEAERNQLYVEAEELLAKDVPIAPIYHYVQTRLVNPKLGGYAENNAEDQIYSKDMYIIAD